MRLFVLCALIASIATTSSAQSADSAQARAKACPSCATWNAPHEPSKIFGNSWYVGTNGLSSVLITSPAGHVLIDAGLPESAPVIMANIRALGFRVEDIKAIVNSHSHYDHAGGIAAIQQASKATVFVSTKSAPALKSGKSGAEDPQYEIALPYPAVSNVKIVSDKETVRVGPSTLTMHNTAGHTAGGTSWTWRSCDGDQCVDLVYADSQSAASSDNFYFTRNTTYPNALDDFERGLAVIENLSCDVLITPHPFQSKLFERISARDKGDSTLLFDKTACRRYVATARTEIAKRVAAEQTKLGK